MWKSNDKKITAFYLLNKKKALSLVELVVITFIIAVIATMAFPTYKIFQQRSKEKRLKKILTDVRAAINGTKSHNSTNYFEEGFRTVARVKGIDIITDNTPDLNERQNFINLFVKGLSDGYGYPDSPQEIWSNNPKTDLNGMNLSYTDATGNHAFPLINFGNVGKLYLERPFYRNCDLSSGPVHPFHDWYQTANFAYIPASDTRGIDYLKNASYTVDEWATMNPDPEHPVLIGVKDIVSRGAGLALDGSNTDEW